MNDKQRKSAERKFGTTIRTRLVFGFTIFVAIVLLIVWIFQVLLLDFFYEQIKLSELRKVQKTIENSTESGDLDEVCSALASQYDVCIVIYSTQNSTLHDVVLTKEVSPTCIIHYAKKEHLETIYSQAKNNNGTITQRFELDPKELSKHPSKITPSKQSGTAIEYDKVKVNNKFIITISAKIFQDVIGNEYVVFTNMNFTPVNTIQETRNIQFAYIAVIVILSAAIFSLVFSYRIAKPLEKMTLSASRMASGDYSTVFEAEGYREARRLAKTLNYAVEEISKTDNFQKELIANVSHDLRTPLTLISGYAEMMRDIPGENTPENSQLIIDEAKRLTNLVNDILDFSKFASKSEQPVFGALNLTESVRRSIGRYAELIKHNGYKIEFIADTNVQVYADERMILQVLYNLISNAINYTGEDKTVRILQDILPDNSVKISISDSGKGIPKEDIEHIWDRYYKVDKTHSRTVVGSGLGLSIVSKLLQLHSASYGVETSAANGTTFWFVLKIIAP